MKLDWSPDGVDWRDESKDREMATDWLHASHEHNFPEQDVFFRVLELTQTDLDPARGWRLVKMLVDIADDDDELWQIGKRALGTIVSNHAELVDDELAVLVRTIPKYRQVLDGQTSLALHEFRKRHHL